MGNCTSLAATIEAAKLQVDLLPDQRQPADDADLVPTPFLAIKGRHLLLRRDVPQSPEHLSTCTENEVDSFDLTALPPDIVLYIKNLLPPRSNWALLQVPNAQLHSTLQSSTHECRLLTPTSPPPPTRHFTFKHPPATPRFTNTFTNTCHLLSSCPTLNTLDLTSVTRHLTIDLLLTLLTSIPPKTLAHITSFKLGPDSQQLPSQNFPDFLACMPALKHLDCCLNSCCVLRTISMKNVLLSVPQLATLTLHPASSFAMESAIDSAMLQTILRCAPPSLKLDLHAWNANMLHVHLQPAAFVNVTSIQLQMTGDFQADTRGALPNLESVRLLCKGAVTFRTLSHSFLATARKLRVLHLVGMEGTGATGWLAALEELQDLVLSHVKFPVYSISYWHSFLCCFPNLQTLITDMCSGIPECCLYPSLPKTSLSALSSVSPRLYRHPPQDLPASPTAPHSHDPSPNPSIDTSPPPESFHPALRHPVSPSPSSPPSHPALTSFATSSTSSASSSQPSSPTTHTPSCTHPHLQTLGFTTHWGTGAHPSYSAVHRWLLSLSRLQATLPSSYALSSLHLHFNNTDAEAGAAIPHLGALAHLPNLTFLKISTTQVRCIDSKMIPSSHLRPLCSLAAVPKLQTLKLLYGWISPPSLSLLLSSLSRLDHLSFVASPDISATRHYAPLLDSLPPSLHIGVTFVATLKDVTHNAATLNKVLESRRVHAVTAILLERKAADRVVAAIRNNPAVEDAEIVLPRCENEVEARETLESELEAEGLRVKVRFHAGCFKAWARALGDPGVLQNAEQGDWRQLAL